MIDLRGAIGCWQGDGVNRMVYRLVQPQLGGKSHQLFANESLEPGRSQNRPQNQKAVDGVGMPRVRYGVKSRPNLELEAQLIIETPFSKYMENFSEYRQGLWEVAKEIGKRAGLKLNVEKLRKKHADIRWQTAI